MALIIAGDRSGVGKTTVTLGILAYLAQQGQRVQSFKVGPDYIDPMFHSQVTGIPCRNLDSVLTSPDYVRDCFQRHRQNVESVVIEGVMGLFDGISNPQNSDSLNDYGSTAHIARILKLPVALVLDCSRLSSSIAAIAYGYGNLDPEVNIAGVILNKVATDRHLELLATALNKIEMPILGIIRRNTDITLRDRHLGLIPSPEISNIKSVFEQLATLAQQSLNWERLFPLINQQSSSPPVPDALANPLGQSPSPQVPQSSSPPVLQSPSPDAERSVANPLGQVPKSPSPQSPSPDAERSVANPLGQVPQSPISLKIAVAKDKAFNFYYQDNLDILRELGAELVFWSPIKERNIPSNVQGFYFGGGFPEVFAQQLADNHNVLQQLQKIILDGIPTYAECGGLMYLCQELIDLEGKSWSMVGVIPSSVTMKAKLTLGYRQAIALQNSSLIKTNQIIRGHEFHHSQLTLAPQNPQWQLQGFHKSSPQLTEGWKVQQLHASYLHLHWGECKHLAQRFVSRCRNYKTSLY